MHAVSSASTRIETGHLMLEPLCGLTMRTVALQPPAQLMKKIAATAPVNNSPPPMAPINKSGDSPLEAGTTAEAWGTEANTSIPPASPGALDEAGSGGSICGVGAVASALRAFA